MKFLRILLLCYFCFSLIACLSEREITPQTAQETARIAWQIDHHIVWEMAWAAAPVGGPLTVETWQANSCSCYRFEILEATTPALIGEQLIFDGQQGWQDHRWNDSPPVPSAKPWLSPVSDLFARVETWLHRSPHTATESLVELNHGPSRKITLYFENDEQLMIWIDEKTDLPIRLLLHTPNQSPIRLQARDFDRLITYPSELFKPLP